MFYCEVKFEANSLESAQNMINDYVMSIITLKTKSINLNVSDLETNVFISRKSWVENDDEYKTMYFEAKSKATDLEVYINDCI